jgi:hypothetical protein
MPRKLEQELKARARRLRLSGRRFRAYVYGTLRRAGWRPEKRRR